MNNENCGENLIGSINPPQFSLYTLIKPAKLRKELDSFGLDKIKGKKDVMVQYHREYCLKSMAENDSINPIDKDDIIESVTQQYVDEKKDKKKPKKELSEDEKKEKVKEMVRFLKKQKKQKMEEMKKNEQKED